MRKTWLSLILLLICKASFAFNAIDAIGVMATGAEPAEAEGKISSCGQNLMSIPKICEAGAGFLCLNTSNLSTVLDYIILRGTIDVKNNILSSLTASVQNEYSNEFKQISFTKPQTADCKNSSSNFCMDSSGYFSINVPLGSKYGPYTIVVTATRANGEPAKEKIRTSRVVEPKISISDIKIIPSQNNAQITIDLLHSCQACDFFGIGTGGMQITATNVINSLDGGVKKTTVKTNIASGGIYSFCVPIENGTNNLTVNACNGATGYETEKCPTIQLEPFSADDLGKSGLTWKNRPKNIYSADTNPTVDLAFKLGESANQSCEESNVKLLFNRNVEQKICSDADGYYRISLDGETGINIGVIKEGDKKYPFTFGWGEIASPFAANGKVKEDEDLAIKTAGGFSIGKSFLTQISRSLLNNYLKSDEFKELLSNLPQMLEKNDSAEQDNAVKEELQSIKNEIPQCRGSSSGEEKNFGIKLTREPVIGSIDIPRVEFKQDSINFTLNAENLKIWANVFLDQDEDGAPDKKALPLKIAFRKIFSPIEIKVDRSGEKPRFILTGPSTNCEYKSKHACDKKPAILVPKDFFGNATEGGSFIRCDDDVEDACKGVNLINAQTGLVSMAVLDAINDKLYCDGSAALTYLIREKIKSVPIQIGCPQNKGSLEPIISVGKCDGVFSEKGWIVPIGLDLLSNQFGVGENGIWGNVPALVGNKEFYSQFFEDLKSPETGFIKRPYLASQPALASSEIDNSSFGIALGEDFINAMLFALSEQNHNAGLLDWDIDERFLKQLGFDAVKECDEFKPQSGKETPSALCNLRMRVGEIMGTPLVTNGYYAQKQPIMIKIRSNGSLSPRIGFFNQNGRQYLDVQIGDLDLSFFALELDTSKQADQFGNLPVKTGSEGRPIITFKLSALLALEISGIETDEEDPSSLALKIRPDANLTRITFRPVEESNTTVLDGSSLSSALEEKINFGIAIYSGKAIKLKLPKEIEIGGNEPDEFSPLGLKKISFGKDGLQLKVEENQEYIDILIRLILTQFLSINGENAALTVP